MEEWNCWKTGTLKRKERAGRCRRDGENHVFNDAFLVVDDEKCVVRDARCVINDVFFVIVDVRSVVDDVIFVIDDAFFVIDDAIYVIDDVICVNVARKHGFSALGGVQPVVSRFCPAETRGRRQQISASGLPRLATLFGFRRRRIGAATSTATEEAAQIIIDGLDASDAAFRRLGHVVVKA